MVIKQPITQVRLTNVAVVRLVVGGMRFELACYPNKVLDWRAGIESDLSEVLQTEHIYSNVSKGKFARREDLAKVFGDDDRPKIYMKILKSGTIQVNERERNQQKKAFLTELYHRVAERLIVKTTQLVPTAAMVEQALKEIHYFPKYNAQILPKSVAQQAASLLCTQLPDTFQRTVMRATLLIKKEGTYDQARTFLVEDLRVYILEDDKTSRIVFETVPSDFRHFETFCKSIEAEMSDVLMHDAPRQPASEDCQDIKLTKTEEKLTDAVLPESSSISPTDSSSNSESETEERVAGSRRLVGFEALQESDEEKTHPDSQKLSQQLHLEINADQPPPALPKREIADFVQTVSDRRRKLRDKERKNLKRDHRERERERLVATVSESGPREEEESNVVHHVEGGCVVCGGAVSGSLRQHYRAGWHIMNEKRRVRGLNPLTKEAFEDLSRDICEAFLAVE